MSDLVIKSGDSGNTAEVDSSNRLQTFSTTQLDSVDASLRGDTFFITSGIINLTTDGQSFIIYIKNDDTVDWIVNEFTQSYGPSTGGAGGSLSNEFQVGPTGGDILSGTPTLAVNMNIGSPKQLAATILTGAEGDTATGGGSVPAGLIVKDQTLVPFTGGPIVIAAGTSFAFAVTPPTGNTSMDAQLDAIIYRKINGQE